MNKYIVICSLLTILYTGCGSGDDYDFKEKVESQISVSSPSFSGAADGDILSIPVECSQAWWTVESSAAWCTAQRVSKDKVSVTLTRNYSEVARTATLTLKTVSNTTNLTIEQFGATSSPYEPIKEYEGYTLYWSDEFNQEGNLDDAYWNYEKGFVRNNELQWYQSDNATCTEGCLVITGRKEEGLANPNYDASSSDWKKNRATIDYTSSSVTTSGKVLFRYGRLEVRAKLPTAMGSWPAIWTLGNWWEWPCCGEIDLLELYVSGGAQSILANTCWGSSTRWSGKWDSSVTPLSTFIAKNPNWKNEFHIWRMDWDAEYVRLYLDDELLNETACSGTQNQGGGISNWDNPFSNNYDGFGHYVLLNLAIGSNGGTPDDAAFPLKYYVDYVRIYQKKN